MFVIANLLKKASTRAPFILYLFFSVHFVATANECQLPARLEPVTIKKVFDGDTVKLSSGKKLRIIGINTPERGRDAEPDEPFYLEAKITLQKIVKKNQQKLFASYGVDRFDRHGRLLGHLFTRDGRNIAETLIQKGLGYFIAIPPNTRFLNCLVKAETEARLGKKGLWKSASKKRIPLSSLGKTTRGFHIIRGQVMRVGQSRSSYWLNLNNKGQNRFALRLLKKDLQYFPGWHIEELLGKTVTARGWIYIANNEQRITIRHPASIQIVTN